MFVVGVMPLGRRLRPEYAIPLTTSLSKYDSVSKLCTTIGPATFVLISKVHV